MGSASWDNSVIVNILTGAAAVTKKGFGGIIHLTEDVTMTDRIRWFTKSLDAQQDTELGPEPKAAVAAFMSQKNHPPKVAIARKDTDEQQLLTDTIQSGVAENDVFKITINSIEGSYTAGAAETETDVAAGLRADLTTKLADEDVTVGGTGADVTIEADVAGEPFSYSSEYDPVGSGTSGITEVLTQENVSLKTELDKVLAEDDTWYAFSIQSRAKLQNQRASEWAEANKRLFSSQSSDAEILSETADNYFEWAVGKSYGFTILNWHSDDDEYKALAWPAFKLWVDPDIRKTTWAHATLIGVTPNDLDVDDQTAIESQNGNVYLTMGGLGNTSPGKLADGNWIDERVSKDWYDARVTEGAFQLLKDVSDSGDSIPYDDTGMGQFESVIRRVMNKGMKPTVKHFRPGTGIINVPSIDDVDPADIQARELTIESEVTLAGGIQKATLNLVVRNA